MTATDDPMVMISIRLPQSLRDAFNDRLKAVDDNASRVVRHAIRGWLTGNEAYCPPAAQRTSNVRPTPTPAPLPQPKQSTAKTSVTDGGMAPPDSPIWAMCDLLGLGVEEGAKND